MKTKKIILGIIGIIIISIVVVLCIKIFVKNNENNTVSIINSDIQYETDDEYTDWQNEQVTNIELKDNSVAINGNGANSQGTTVTINKPGNYHITGTLEDGTIIVDTTGVVRLILENASIKASTTAPINVKNAKKVVVSLEGNSINYIEDGETYTYDDTAEEEPDGAVFSKDDLVINGTGTLNVIAHFKDGIVSKDTLKIMSGNININATGDGIRGKDSVAIKNGEINITAQNDGIKSTNDSDTTLGFILVNNGVINITAEQDAFQAETSIVIENGEFNLTTGGGSEALTNTNNFGNWGTFGTSTSSDTTSAKGIKAKTGIKIINGKFNIDSADDSIHSNSDLTIENGVFEIASGDDRNACR